LAGPKTTWPGRKEAYRHAAWHEDVVQLDSEPAPAGYTRLLRPVMRQGRVVAGSLPPLGEVWETAQANLAALPERWRALKTRESYPVRFSDALQQLRTRAIQEVSAQNPTSGTDSRDADARTAPHNSKQSSTSAPTTRREEKAK
jgi:nicotinate phosphoribosyltransferase